MRDLPATNPSVPHTHRCNDHRRLHLEIGCGPYSADRDGQLRVAKEQMKRFFSDNGGWALHQSQVILVVAEMIKNTMDHARCKAALTVDVEHHHGQPFHLSFTYREHGKGLCAALRERTDVRQALQQQKTGDTPLDLLRWAFTAGNSTLSGNGVNLGAGLTVIVEGARAMGMTLTMVDGHSSISLDQLTGGPTRAALRAAISTVPEGGGLTYTGSKYYQDKLDHSWTNRATNE
jgi:hypothetical protein